MNKLSIDKKIRALLDAFGDAPEAFSLEEVQPEKIPEPYRRLLVHHAHMTVTMETFHKNSVVLKVIQKERKDNLYLRKILLCTESNPKVVQFGIMQMNFGCCSEQVCDEVLSERAPLGRILIQHDILRHIEMDCYFRLRTYSELTRLFELTESSETYGRLATIFCNDQPAVKLLEIPAPFKL